MTTVPPFAGLEFVHPDFDRAAGRHDAARGASGLQLTPSGQLSSVDRHQAIRQSLLMLLTTHPGERLMRPDYGCRLSSLAFSPNDDTTAGMAVHFVRQAIERWEPRVAIDRIRAERSPGEPGRLVLVLDYHVIATRRQDSLAVPVSLSEQDI